MHTKVIASLVTLSLALLCGTSSAYANTQLLQRDFMIEKASLRPQVLASTPQIVPNAEAKLYTAGSAAVHPFSGWRLLTISVLFSSFGGFFLWRFVSRETELMERS